MTARKLMALFVVAHVLYFAALGGIIYWGATTFYRFAIYQGWVQP